MSHKIDARFIWGKCILPHTDIGFIKKKTRYYAKERIKPRIVPSGFLISNTYIVSWWDAQADKSNSTHLFEVSQHLSYALWKRGCVWDNIDSGYCFDSK